MNDAQQQFIDDIGQVFEAQGSTRMLGEVLGLLMISAETELTAAEIAATLGASRGAISTVTRQLVTLALIRKRHKPGDRKDYFIVAPNAWANVLQQKDAEVHRLRLIFERGLTAMGDASDAARAPMIESIEFLRFWESEIASIRQRWHDYLEQRDAERHSNP